MGILNKLDVTKIIKDVMKIIKNANIIKLRYSKIQQDK